MNFALKILIAGTVLITLFTIVPFEISLPKEVVEFFTNGAVNKLVSFCSFLAPVGFFINCLLCIYLARFAGIFWGMLTWLYNKFFA